MYSADHEAFVELLDQLAMIFGRKKPTDEFVKGYWHALRDVTLQTMRECAERHMRHGKFFPKPFELRPHDDKPPTQESQASRATFEAGQRFNVESWEFLRAADPELHRQRLREAQLSRLEVTTSQSSPAYEQIRREANSAASERLAARRSRW